jgi:hypothetical protein
LRPTTARRERLILLAKLFEWTYQLDPIRLVRTGKEPEFGLMIPNRVAER